jgi:hypothetical protein
MKKLIAPENILLWSEEFDNSGWYKTSIGTYSLSVNAYTAPNSTDTGDIISDVGSAVATYFHQIFPMSYDAIYTFSLFVRKDGIGQATRHFEYGIDFSGGTYRGNRARFDTDTGELVLSNSPSDNVSAAVVDYDDNWWRVSLSAQDAAADANTSLVPLFYPAKGTDLGATDVTVTGSVTLWGAQLSVTSGTITYAKSVGSPIHGPFAEVELMPEWNYKEPSGKVESRQRSRTGREYVYKRGDFDAVTFDVTHVNSQVMSQVNSWWAGNTPLAYYDADESELLSMSCHLTNSNTPIGKIVRPYTNLFKGEIMLGTY